MVTAEAFIGKCRVPLDGKWGYIWGTSGIVWTEARQKAATREMTVKYGARWIGRLVTDCSGLLRWALKQLGEDIVHHARYQYTEYCANKGKLIGGRREDGQPVLPGTAVFLKGSEAHIHHVGVYLGCGVCVEAKGTLYGVVTSALDHWDYWGELKMVDYTGAAALEGEPQEPQGTTMTAKVCNPQTWLNVRTGPGTQYQKMYQVEKGSVVEVIDAGDPGWWQIRYGGRIGWAAAEYLRLIEEEEEKEEDEGMPSEEPQPADGGDPGPDPVPDPAPDLSVILEELRRIRESVDRVMRMMGGEPP